MDPCKFGSHHDVSSLNCATTRSLGADETLKEHEGDCPATPPGARPESGDAAASGDRCPTAQAAQAAKCSPASRALPLGGGCGSNPR